MAERIIEVFDEQLGTTLGTLSIYEGGRKGPTYAFPHELLYLPHTLSLPGEYDASRINCPLTQVSYTFSNTTIPSHEQLVFH